MLDWFTWKGVDCTDYGIHALTQPNRVRPKERFESISIPGRSGALTQLEGDDVYDNITVSFLCIVHDDSRLDEINTYLSGKGKLSPANRPNGFFNGRLNSQIDYASIVRGNPHKNFSVAFDCEPFFYLSSGDVTTTYSKPKSGKNIVLNNPGNIWSAPLFTVYGTGDCDITFGTKTISLTDIGSVPNGYITVDCAAKVAYTGIPGSASTPVQLVGTHVSGLWPTIGTGSTNMVPTGSITKIQLTPRWRFL